MKKYGLGVLLLVIAVITVGCGKSIHEMDDTTKSVMDNFIEEINRSRKKTNSDNVKIDAERFYSTVRLEDIKNIYVIEGSEVISNEYYVVYSTKTFYDKEMSETRSSRLAYEKVSEAGEKNSHLSDSEFQNTIKDPKVEKIYESKE